MSLAAVVVIVCGVLGVLVGSFLNVVIHRVPLGQSVVRPSSACPECGHRIRPRDNVPVVSWVILRGRCRDCGAPISVRYALVEAATGLLWAGFTWWALAVDQPGLVPLLLVLVSAGVALFAIDLRWHRLPDAIVVPLYPVTALGLALAWWIAGSANWLGVVAGVLVWTVPIGTLWLASGGRGMGFGDVKLAPVLGAVLGWVGAGAALVGLFAAFALGAVVGVGLLVTRRAGRRSHVPFGPFMLTGAGVGLLLGESVASWYLAALFA